MDSHRVTELEPGIVHLELTRPHRRNALSSNAVAELHREIDRIGGDPDIRVVILSGAGTSFCSGADMKAGPTDSDATDSTAIGSLFGTARGDLARSFAAQELMASLFEKIHRLRQPVIAAVNGHAHGGGFALALACDIRVASQSASFGAVFIKRGISACDMGTSYFLPRLVGAARSAELLLTGRVFDAVEARDMGLVTDVVDEADLLETALGTARLITGNSPLAVWMTKETMWQTLDAPSLRFALDIENRTQIMCTTSGEATTAFEAFIERRPPQWAPL
ncbi:enoyl-CoA hydratase/isomerase family protein [Mycobacterium sp. AZCC_0083]|uniref:enoyl-CoA hydratase/isomerase family protein n=1 Tax=Mycobacterium sp. AZCC_0083 TaxID=2735882 RepID=UPI0016145FCD|nr:enoyl-CoA hydratase/isomerase family protein [Mycobacterium sp. AZCC_0083]MBB5166427.1 enoyl-CoA hydratase/carnithine racemase [Mycobacterium sp. AZCC_0083]